MLSKLISGDRSSAIFSPWDEHEQLAEVSFASLGADFTQRNATIPTNPTSKIGQPRGADQNNMFWLNVNSILMLMTNAPTSFTMRRISFIINPCLHMAKRSVFGVVVAQGQSNRRNNTHNNSTRTNGMEYNQSPESMRQN